jgi:hypothetical protein
MKKKELNIIARQIVLVLFINYFPFSVVIGQTGSLIDVNYQNLVSRADLTYDTPVIRSEEGMPIGNGITGSLVWTAPSAIKFQINRVDVFANDATSVSFPKADSDFGSSCGYIDINFVDAFDDVFTGNDFKQHLSVYNGLVTIKGSELTAKIFAYHENDIIAVEIDDKRENPKAINIDLRMLRYAIQMISGRTYELAKNHQVEYQTAEHTALSQLHIDNGRILLTQKYTEREYYNATGIAIDVIGRQSKAQYLNESTVQLTAAPGKGKFTILISSASSFDKEQDIKYLALNELNAVKGKSFDELLRERTSWWADFWSKGFVHLTSESGQADFVEKHYTYFLYIMSSTSLGKFPPKFNGLLFNTTGDMRRWGSQYWWANTDVYYNNLIPANRLDLINPVYSMYTGMYESCAFAARQQWGSKGIWIPEIVTFNGLEKLPDDIGKELQDLVLVRKPYEDRSEEFQWFIETKNRHHARWNFLSDGYWDHGHYVVPTKASVQPERFASPDLMHGIFGHCTHILGSGGRIAELYWQRYEYTMDKEWLRESAYPMIKGSVEFYSNFPNLKKGEDGKYHLLHVNNNESGWNSTDSRHELLIMHMIFPIAIHASEVLGIDADLRVRWKEIHANLMPEPEGPRRFGGQGGGSRSGYGAFVYGGPGEIEPIGKEAELKSMCLNFNRTGGFIDEKGIGGAQILSNRMRLREGPGAIDAEHIGGLTMGIHSSLLQNAADKIEQDPIIQVFPSWPNDWDAKFNLLARGGFRVTSSQKKGVIEFVELQSQYGKECHLQNPWGASEVTLYRNGEKSENLSGTLLSFHIRENESIIVVNSVTKPEQFKGTVLY